MVTPRRPTMRDVAAQADVSFKTVSRVVNNEGGVSDELQKRVEDAVSELGYLIDHRARGLRQTGAQAVTIGFVLVDVSNPFFSKVFRGIEEVAKQRDCLVLAGSTEGSEEREHQLIDAFVGRRVDGLIVVPSGSNADALRLEIERGTPVVFVDIEPSLESFNLVRSDHVAGARAAAEHLIAQGHRDVAYFGDELRFFSARLRLEGFLAAMADAGIEVPPERIKTGAHSDEEWRSLAVEYLTANPRPTAIFSAQNFVTLGVTKALHQLGVQHSIAQVGFDDIELADVVEPGVTVVSQQPLDIGRRSAELLFGLIDAENETPTQQILPVPLIVRGSGEIAPSE
ncbi:MAG: LacI family DNA-binding transcriptional regulator [Acidimicrobiales bacterium]